MGEPIMQGFVVQIFSLNSQEWTELVKLDTLAQAEEWVEKNAQNHPGRQIRIDATYSLSIEHGLFQYSRDLGLLKMTERKGWQPVEAKLEATNG